MKYELVVDDCNQEHRETFEDQSVRADRLETAIDAFRVAALRGKFFTLTLSCEPSSQYGPPGNETAAP
ncbi:MAG: hypothetical protein WBE80_10195 [Methylocella sp.]